MMNKNLIFLLLLSCNFVFSQKQDLSAEPVFEVRGNDSIYTKASQPPVYPGGINAFRKTFSQRFNAGSINSRGPVTSEARFIISETGDVADIEVTGNSKSMNREMKRVVQAISGVQWIPARVNGKPVKFMFRLPITMDL